MLEFMSYWDFSEAGVVWEESGGRVWAADKGDWRDAFLLVWRGA